MEFKRPPAQPADLQRDRGIGQAETSLRVFAIEAVTDFRTVAAVAPSSRYLTRAMLEPLPLNRARVVVELGAGTGVMTRALLDALSGDSILFAFEINSRFFRYLESNLSDSRLVLVNADVEQFGQELRRRGSHRVEAVVSSIALGYMSDQQRHNLLSQVTAFLDHKGVLTQYQYIHGLQFGGRRFCRFDATALLRRYFRSVQRKTAWCNLPPAFVFACQK